MTPAPTVTPGASAAAPAPPSKAQGRTRDAWFDTLRAAALVRVVIYHVFGWVWLPAAFPSMGIMFALAGTLMAASLDRAAGDYWKVLRKRLRRLLPPLWVMGLILVPVMLWTGWTATGTGGTPLRWSNVWLWILPVSDPPGSAWGQDLVVPLWYIRTYLWLVLLSPAFLWLFRHWPRRVLVLPLVVMALIVAGVFDTGGRAGDILLTLATFGSCWLLGFATHDGKLRSWAWSRVAPIGLAAMAAGLAWAFTHQVPGAGWNLDEIPMAQALYSVGAVLLLMRGRPDFSWMARHPVISGLVTVANRRAVTIYLYNNLAILLATPLADSWSVTAALDVPGLQGELEQFVLAWVLLGGIIVALGWVEDVAAGRPGRVNPWPVSSGPRPSGSIGAIGQRIRANVPLQAALGAGAILAVLGTVGWQAGGAIKPADPVPVETLGEAPSATAPAEQAAPTAAPTTSTSTTPPTAAGGGSTPGAVRRPEGTVLGTATTVAPSRTASRTAPTVTPAASTTVTPKPTTAAGSTPSLTPTVAPGTAPGATGTTPELDTTTPEPTVTAPSGGAQASGSAPAP